MNDADELRDAIHLACPRLDLLAASMRSLEKLDIDPSAGNVADEIEEIVADLRTAAADTVLLSPSGPPCQCDSCLSGKSSAMRIAATSTTRAEEVESELERERRLAGYAPPQLVRIVGDDETLNLRLAPQT